MSASPTSQLEASPTLQQSQSKESSTPTLPSQLQRSAYSSTPTLPSQLQRSASLESQLLPLLPSSSRTIPQPPASSSRQFSAPPTFLSPLPQNSPPISHRSDPPLVHRYVPSTDELQSLESFERQLDKLQSRELALLKQADDAIASLGTTTQILLALFGYTAGSNLSAAVVSDARFHCLSGFGLVVLSTLCFVLGFGVSLFIARRKMTNLDGSVKKLKDRHERLLKDIGLFRDEFKTQDIYLSTEVVPHPSVGRPNPRVMETAFGRRLGELILPSRQWEISKSYTWVIVLIGMGAFFVAFTVTLMAWFIFCHGDGGEKPWDLGFKYPS